MKNIRKVICILPQKVILLQLRTYYFFEKGTYLTYISFHLKSNNIT